MTPVRADSRDEDTSTIEDQRRESRQAFMGTLENMRASLKPFIPSLGGLDFDAGAGAQHVGVPSDLFTVSVRSRHDPAQRPPCDEGLQVVISPIRTEAREFSVVGRAQVVVASLTPLGMLSVFRGGFEGMVDRPVPLSALCGEPRERDLIRALDAASTLTESCEAFTRWLEAGIVERGALSSGDLRVARTALLMSTAEARAFELSDLARIESVTRRQLERDFGRHLGVSPGGYGRIVRFQRAAAAVAKGQPLLHAAIDNGFADQAHMNRTFREFSGMTPSQLAAQGARPGQDVVRAGLAGRVFLFDVQSPPAQRGVSPASAGSRPAAEKESEEEGEAASFAA
jgi:AraC-like DNA-binding protein